MSPPVLLGTRKSLTDFEEIERNQREGGWDLVGDLLAREGNKLKATDADFFLLACSTVHTADQRVESAVDLPFIHIVDPTARQILRRGLTPVGVLGSRYTMTGSYFVNACGRLRPEGTGRRRRAPGECAQRPVRGTGQERFLPATREKFRAAIADLVERGAEAAILRCTEFGMLVEADGSPVPLVDTTIAHAEAAVNMALAEETSRRAER